MIDERDCIEMPEETEEEEICEFPEEEEEEVKESPKRVQEAMQAISKGGKGAPVIMELIGEDGGIAGQYIDKGEPYQHIHEGGLNGL